MRKAFSGFSKPNLALPLAAAVGLLALQAAWPAAPKLQPERILRHTGLCDASAAVAVSSNLFLVATDEENTIRLYRADAAGAPVKEWAYDLFLRLTGKAREVDIEGAAQVGHRVYWIGSHGRNASGHDAPNRRRFFATELGTNSAGISLAPVGRPAETLLSEMMADPKLRGFRLDLASRLEPKAPGGLNIEGLVSTPEGHVLIGFRNPVPAGKALLVPLLNPAEVVEGRRAQFGEPLSLDLDGLGIRDMARQGWDYTLIAGPVDGKGKFRIFTWRGPGTTPAELRTSHLGKFNPEALVLYPETGLAAMHILSDDGNQSTGGQRCKDIKDPAKRTFRSFWLMNPS